MDGAGKVQGFLTFISACMRGVRRKKKDVLLLVFIVLSFLDKKIVEEGKRIMQGQRTIFPPPLSRIELFAFARHIYMYIYRVILSNQISYEAKHYIASHIPFYFPYRSQATAGRAWQAEIASLRTFY